MNWYILQVYSGFENKVAEAINELAAKRNLHNNIQEILIPTHDFTQVRYGKKMSMKKKFLPGYILIKVDLTEDLLHLIRSIPRVSSFIGSESKSGLPFPVSEAEVERLINYSLNNSNSSENVELLFSLGDSVHITSGPFASFSGTVEEIEEDKKKIKVSVSIFGRLTPVELEYHQVEKVKE